MSRRKTKRPPIGWAWRRGWRRLVALVKRRLEAVRKNRTRKARRGAARRQLRCPACNLFVRRLCQILPDPCGMCPACCPGHKKPDADQQDGGRFTTSVQKA